MMIRRADRRGMKKPLTPKTITMIEKHMRQNMPTKNLAMSPIP
jgi:hypothetical protein